MQPPVLGFAAYSGTGKTTLLEQLIPLLKVRGVRVAVLKHAHHDFDIDKPGKDSYRLRKSGADQMLIASDQRWALMAETAQPTEFETLLSQFNHDELDLIIVEGFKGEAIPKIELHRPLLGHDLICQLGNRVYADNACGGKAIEQIANMNFIAVASDQAIELPEGLTFLDLNNVENIADYIVNEFLNA